MHRRVAWYVLSTALLAVLVAALVAGLAASVLALPAAAHASATVTSPATGATLDASPLEVSVSFTEPLEPSLSSLDVRNATGALQSGPSSLDAKGTTLHAALPAPLANGTFQASWRALSAIDGHASHGAWRFHVGNSTALDATSTPIGVAEPIAVEEQVAVVGPLDSALRAAMYAGSVVLLGCAVLALGILRGEEGPPAAGAAAEATEVSKDAAPDAAAVAATAAVLPSKSLVKAALVAGVLGAGGTVALALAQAASAAPQGWADVAAHPSIALAGRYGTLAALRAPLLLAAGLAPWVAQRRGPARVPDGLRLAWVWACTAAFVLVAFATLSFTSHAAALPSFTLPAVFADWVHLTAVGAWIGGLVGLGWVVLRSRDSNVAMPRTAARFSAVATVSVGVVLLTGTAASLLRIHNVTDLVATAYGQVLLVKLSLVALLLAMGARNRFVLLPRLASADASKTAEAWARFGPAVRAEAVLGIATLIAAGMLTSMSPPLQPLTPGAVSGAVSVVSAMVSMVQAHGLPNLALSFVGAA